MYQPDTNKLIRSVLVPGMRAARFSRPTFVSTADPNTLDGRCSELSTGGCHRQTKQISQRL